MKRSLNEVETTLRKAALAVGLPTGLAEDAARAGIWLATNGHDGVKAVLQGLAGGARAVEFKDEVGSRIFPNARAVLAGPSAVDLMAADKAVRQVRLLNVDSPLLVLGLAAVLAGDYRVALRIDFGIAAQASVSADHASLSGSPSDAACDITISRDRTGVRPIGPQVVPSNGVAIDEAQWNACAALAARTYVPNNPDSRARGAGAGELDND